MAGPAQRTIAQLKTAHRESLTEFLRYKTTASQPRRNLKGLWADLNIDITEEDITEARREMWGNFPRELLQ